MNENLKELSNSRRTDLDWLRIFGVLLLIPFHCALIFVLSPNAVMYIKDSVNSVFLDKFAGWIHQYHMPILFYVAGASTFFALGRRTPGEYIKERFLKLLIPAISGIVLLIPPMTYITRCVAGTEISFWQHFVEFWRINPSDISGMNGGFTPAHLWFLVFLFLFSIIGLPLFVAVKKESHQEAVRKVTSVIHPVGSIVVFIILSVVCARVNLLGDLNPLYYFVVFLSGFFFMTDSRIQMVIDRVAVYALILAVGTEAVRMFFFGQLYELTHSEFLLFIIAQLNRWLWILAFLGIGHRVLTFRGPVLKYLSEASFPFYIFHLIICTIVGYFVIKIQAPIAVKYIIIVVLSNVGTFLTYEIIRRIPGVRVLFGVKGRGNK